MKKKELESLKMKVRALLTGRNHRKAVRLLQQLCEVEPDEPRWPHKLGECHERMEDTASAVAAFQIAARRYAERGFAVKAIALGKLILGLDPGHRETQDMIADLCASEAPAPLTLTAEPSAGAGDEVGPPAGAGGEAEPVVEVAPPRMIPLGESLDSIDLRHLVPALRQVDRDAAPDAAEQGAAFEIPLGDAPDGEPAAAAPLDPDQLPPTPLFSSLDRAAMRQLIEQVAVRHFERGEEIIRQGNDGASLYVLVDGVVHVDRDGVRLGTLQEGAFFGEIALLTKLQRSATVRASEDCTVLEIDRETMGELIEGHPAVLTVMLRFFRERLIDTLVDTSALFEPFAGPDRRALVERFRWIEAEPRCQLLSSGEPADGLYILLSGRVDVLRSPEGGKTVRAQLSTGDMIGERALLGDGRSAVTARTVTKCWLLKLDRQAFREVIMTHPHVLAVLSERAERQPAAVEAPAEPRLQLV